LDGIGDVKWLYARLEAGGIVEKEVIGHMKGLYTWLEEGKVPNDDAKMLRRCLYQPLE